jgi:hypothetical protein
MKRDSLKKPPVEANSPSGGVDLQADLSSPPRAGLGGAATGTAVRLLGLTMPIAEVHRLQNRNKTYKKRKATPLITR